MALLLAGVFCNACRQDPAKHYYEPHFTAGKPVKKIVRIGFLPSSNPQYLHQIYGPLVDYLNTESPECNFQFVSSVSYDEFNNRLKTGYFSFALANGMQALDAANRYRIFAKIADDRQFRGIILLRKDSRIQQLSDLKNKTISFPSQHALASTLLTQYFLYEKGLRLQDYKSIFCISHESSIMNAFLRRSDAATAFPTAWMHFQKNNPGIAAQLQVKWETPSLVNFAWIANRSEDPVLFKKMNNLLLSLHLFEEGNQLLKKIGVEKFGKADSSMYEPVKDFLNKYDHLVKHEPTP